MGLFEVIGELVLGCIMNSDTEVGNATRKGYNYLSDSANKTKQRLEMESRIQANNSKNKERDGKESRQENKEYEPKEYKPITIK